MYIDHDFDGAIKMWDTAIVRLSLDQVYNQYQKRRTPLKMEEVRENYRKYFNQVGDYRQVGAAKLAPMESQDSMRRIFVSYNYHEIKNEIQTTGQNVLILMSYDFGKTWLIIDSRAFGKL